MPKSTKGKKIIETLRRFVTWFTLLSSPLSNDGYKCDNEMIGAEDLKLGSVQGRQRIDCNADSDRG